MNNPSKLTLKEHLKSGSKLSRLAVRVAFLTAFAICIKFAWVLSFQTNGDKLLQGKAKTDLLERRAYLLSETLNIDHIRAAVPPGVGSQIEGEMVISTCCMTTLALTNLSFSDPETRKESLDAIRRLIRFVIAPEQREYERASWNDEDPLESIAGEHGHTWYLGNVNFMIGAYKYLGGGSEFDQQMEQITSALCRRYLQSDSPMLESYPHECYSPDNLMAISSLANAEKFFKRSNDKKSQSLSIQCAKAIRSWVGKVHQSAIDLSTGAIAFRFDNGTIVQGSRGIGVGWNCYFLPLIDSALAKEQYGILKERFVKKALGVFTGLREYPNEDGEGDVDSGPVIFGLSMSGTGFGIGAAHRMNDAKLISDISFTVESAGSTVSSAGKRHYLLSPLVGEAAMLAMYSTTTWNQRFLHSNQLTSNTGLAP